MVLTAFRIWTVAHAQGRVLDAGYSLAATALLALIVGMLLCWPWRTKGSVTRNRLSGWMDFLPIGLGYAAYFFVVSWALAITERNGIPIVAASALSGFALWAALDVHNQPAVEAPAVPAPRSGSSASSDGNQQEPVSRSEERKRRRFRVSLVLAAAAFTIPLLADFSYMKGKLNLTILRGLGLRAEDTTVRLKGQALATARSHQAITGAGVSFCDEPDGSALVAPVTVLWHGMGKRSALSLGNSTALSERSPDDARGFEVDASEIKVIHNGARQCRDLEREIFFPSKKVRYLPDEMKSMLDEMQRTAGVTYAALTTDQKQWRLDRVLVSGFADGMPQAELGNEELARSRAACVAVEVNERLKHIGKTGQLNPQIEWDGRGARLPPRTTCPTIGKAADLVECNRPNRRTHIRLIFECTDLSAQPSTGCVVESADAQPGSHRSMSTRAISSDAAASSIEEARLVCSQVH